MTFLTVLGVLVIIFCTFSALSSAKPNEVLFYIVVAVVVTVAIGLLPRPTIVSDDDISDADLYEQARDICFEKQDHTDQYLGC